MERIACFPFQVPGSEGEIDNGERKNGFASFHGFNAEFDVQERELGIMRKVIQFDIHEVAPSPIEVLESQGMAGRENLPVRIRTLLDSALDLFKELAEPRGILEEWPVTDFETVYNGQGLNSPDGPVPKIVSQADGLAIFAATLGNALISKSNELFAKGGPALGFMLDAVNSSGAERLGRFMAHRFLELLPEELRQSKKLKAQYYSPGHCGWHISGQARLFELLHPEEIGVSLNTRWVMLPVKSISGFLVAGETHIHRFRPNFPFCKDCKEHKCVQRLAILENTN